MSNIVDCSDTSILHILVREHLVIQNMFCYIFFRILSLFNSLSSTVSINVNNNHNNGFEWN